MIRLKFWGVRGSTPTPQIENLRYGGNTSCLELRLPDNQSIIFDAGSGLRNLGSSLVKEANGTNLDLKVFLTHFHWDHIQGIPFFAPLFLPGNRVTFHSHCNGSLEEILEGQMARPYFPIDLASVAAKREFVDLDSQPATFSGVTVRPFPLNHPQGAVGYRIEIGKTVIVYATDLEHGHPRLDAVLREYAAGADLLVYDAQYSPESYPKYRGWGHSTWEEGVRVARDAGARQLLLFHHDPSYDDARLDEIAAVAGQAFDAVSPAREGSVVEFS
ncbi:MAG TPA: MBL fold metallo-hydrolase [Bryobacteraceae bacterium]